MRREILFLKEKRVNQKKRRFLIGTRFISFWVIFFSIYVSIGLAKEEEGKNVVLEEMTVTSPPYSNPITPINTQYGTQYNLVTEEQMKEQNVYDFQPTLRNVPGVMFRSWNLMGTQTSHSLYIRGRGSSHPSADFPIEFDGVPRYGAIFGQVLGDSIAISAIGGIEVYKSPQLNQFGSGYALVNVLPKYLKKDGYEVSLNFSGGSYYTFYESLSGGVKKGAFDVYVSQSLADTEGHRDSQRWAEAEGRRDRDRAQQQNYYVNTGYALNKEWSIRLLTNYVKSKTEAPMPEIKPTPTNGVSWPGAERYDTETFFTTLTLNHQYERARGYLKGYWNETTFDLLQELTSGRRYGSGTGGLWSRQEISLYGIRGKEKLLLWPGGEILVGADLDMTDLKNTQRTYSGVAVPGINGGQAKRIWDYPNTTLFSPYLAINQMVGRLERFHIIPSAVFRYFEHDEFKDKSAFQVGVVAGYAHTDLHFNYSRGVIYPSPVVVMNLVVSTSAVANPDQYWKKIKPEVVDHYEVGLTHTWSQIATLGATAFWDNGKDRFQAYMFGPIPLQFNDPIGKYKIRGLELTGTITPIKDLECFAGATWLKVKATGNNGITQEHMPYTPGFQFQAGVKWMFLNHFRLYLDLQHLRDVYQGTARRSGTFNFPTLTRIDKLDDITLVNARLSHHFNLRPLRISDSEVFLAVNNLFDKEYEYNKGYPMPGFTIFGGVNIKFL